MEFIKTVNGFGRIKLDAAEQQLLVQLEEVVSGNGVKYTLGELNEPTGKYEKIMHDLFPMIPLVKSAGVHDSRFQDVYNARKCAASSFYEVFAQSKELIIGSRLGIGRYSTDVDLRIIMPYEEHFMSVVLGDTYWLGCRDDIVRVLGERENPALAGAQIIRRGAPINHEYGIPEVPHLQAILKLYDRAADLVGNMEKTIGVTQEELQELRKDSLKHPNIALRKLSGIEYHRTLEALTNHQ